MSHLYERKGTTLKRKMKVCWLDSDRVPCQTGRQGHDRCLHHVLKEDGRLHRSSPSLLCLDEEERTMPPSSKEEELMVPMGKTRCACTTATSTTVAHATPSLLVPTVLPMKL